MARKKLPVFNETICRKPHIPARVAGVAKAPSRVVKIIQKKVDIS
jgi:hypothetical protein